MSYLKKHLKIKNTPFIYIYMGIVDDTITAGNMDPAGKLNAEERNIKDGDTEDAKAIYNIYDKLPQIPIYMTNDSIITCYDKTPGALLYRNQPWSQCQTNRGWCLNNCKFGDLTMSHAIKTMLKEYQDNLNNVFTSLIDKAREEFITNNGVTNLIESTDKFKSLLVYINNYLINKLTDSTFSNLITDVIHLYNIHRTTKSFADVTISLTNAVKQSSPSEDRKQVARNSLFATKVPFDLDTVKSIINNHITIRITENNIINSNISTPIIANAINNSKKLLDYILKMLNIDILINELSNASTITAIGKPLLDQSNTKLNESTTKLNESKTLLNQCNTSLNESKTSLDQSNTKLNESNTKLNEANTKLNESTSAFNKYTLDVFNYKKDGCDKYTSMSKNEKEKLVNMSKSVSNYLIKMCTDTKPEKFTNTTTCSDSYIVLLLLLVLVSIIYFSVR